MPPLFPLTKHSVQSGMVVEHAPLQPEHRHLLQSK